MTEPMPADHLWVAGGTERFGQMCHHKQTWDIDRATLETQRAIWQGPGHRKCGLCVHRAKQLMWNLEDALAFPLRPKVDSERKVA